MQESFDLKNAALESQAIRKVAVNNARNPLMQFLLS